jgi:hypothetical protein
MLISWHSRCGRVSKVCSRLQALSRRSVDGCVDILAVRDMAVRDAEVRIRSVPRSRSSSNHDPRLSTSSWNVPEGVAR